MSLHRAALAIRENFAQAMAVTAPLGSVVSTTTAAIAYASTGVVFATILAFIASAFWVYTLSMYSRRIASAGGYYTFVYAAYRSSFLAFSEAFIEILSFIFLNVVNVLAVYLMVEALFSFYGLQLPELVGFLLIVLSLLYPTLVSIAIDVKKLLGYIVAVVATLEVLILFALFTLTLSQGFRVDLVLPPKDVSLAGLAIAFLLILVSFDGAGAATYLGEETRKPLDNVTKGMWLAFILGGLAMVTGTYALVALWPYSYTSLAESSQPLIVITAKFGVIYVLLVILIATKSLLISNIGTTLAAARILYNLARENSAPEVLAKVNDRGQPVTATLLVGFITAILTLLSITILDPRTAFVEMGAVTGVFWIAGRILDSLGAPLFLYRIGELKPGVKAILGILLPLATFSMNVAGLVLSAMGISLLQVLILTFSLILGVIWYLALARFGAPGSLVVDNQNNLIRLEELLGQKHGGQAA